MHETRREELHQDTRTMQTTLDLRPGLLPSMANIQSRLKLTSQELQLLCCGLLALLPYLYAVRLGDLRENTPAFLGAFFASFIFYGLACGLAVRMTRLSSGALWGVFTLGAIMLGLLLFTPPTLSDDMYRYIWDGRVQAQGISPYLYSPDSDELRGLRDGTIWPDINRKSAVTIYPPVAEMIFAALWRLWPDNVRWFQGVMSAGALLGGYLLLKLLQELQLPTSRLVIYLWSPLLIYETAHSAHLEGLVLPLLVLAWWMGLRNQPGLSGLILGLATGIKLYPAFLFPALWRRDKPAAWRYPTAFFGVLIIAYLPYWLSSRAGVLGFLPKYIRDLFNVPPHIQLLHTLLKLAEVDWRSWTPLLGLLILGLLGVLMLVRPPKDALSTLRRSAWIIAAYTLISQNLFSWYMLWILPLIAVFLWPPGESHLRAWTGWWLFCGLVGLSYSFFASWKPIPAAIWGQYLPLYLFLLVDLAQKTPKVRSLLWKKPSLPTF